MTATKLTNIPFKSRPSGFLPTASVSEPGAFVCALQSLKKQLIDFRFHYPLEIVHACGAKTSLAYYLYSDKLSWSALRLDARGIPQAWYRMTGKQYWPAYIAWYGIVNLGHYLHKQEEAALDVFLHQVNWLKEHAVVRPDRSVVWTMNFDYPVGAVTLRAPWVSAHAQGLCISALVRAWRITQDQSLMELLEGCSKVFMSGSPLRRDSYSCSRRSSVYQRSPAARCPEFWMVS